MVGANVIGKGSEDVADVGRYLPCNPGQEGHRKQDLSLVFWSPVKRRERVECFSAMQSAALRRPRESW